MLNKLLNILNNLRTGSRSALGYFTIIFFALLTSITAIVLLQFSKNIDERLSKNFTPAINATKDIHLIIDESIRHCANIVNQNDKISRLKLQKIINKQYRRRKIFLIELLQEPGLSNARKMFVSVDQFYTKVIEKQRELLEITTPISNTEASQLLLTAIKEDGKKLEINIDEIERNVTDASNALQSEKYKSYSTLRFSLLIMMVVLVLIAAISLIITNETIVNPIKQVSELLKIMGKGEIVKFEETTNRKDEIGDMIESAKNLSLGMKNKADVAFQIGKGNYEIEVQLQGKNDKLGRALLEMRNNLIESKKTETKNLHDLELYTKNLEKRNKELDQFAYITSHDLKSPLRGINNLAEWIAEDMEDSMSEESKKYFVMLRGRVHRMEALINSLLKYSRAGKVNNDVEKININTIVNEVLKRLAPDSKFAIYFDSNFPTILANYQDIDDIFYELISNAIKYNNSEKPIINITYKTEKNYYVFCVADNGEGVAQEYHQKIFTIFQTLETRDKVESVGAGLAIVKKIVEENGGTIWIESEKGKGAKFYFKWQIPTEITA
ncbi:MAG: GHKL domain-containing protein [Bacteroidia bacterium]|nr:GHKL domain-containing protein [Bacteroidia bacterium]